MLKLGGTNKCQLKKYVYVSWIMFLKIHVDYMYKKENICVMYI